MAYFVLVTKHTGDDKRVGPFWTREEAVRTMHVESRKESTKETQLIEEKK